MSYQGGEAPIIFGDLGLVGSAAMATLPPNALLRAENVAYQTSELIPALGSQKINGSTLGASVSIPGLIEWVPTTVARRLIAMLSDGRILRDDGAGTFAITLASGKTIGVDPVMAVGGLEAVGNNKKLFMTLKVGKVQILDGDAATTRDIGASAPSEWVTTPPRTLVSHAARMWGFAGDRAYASSVLDHENFLDTANGALTKVVGPGVGERVEGALPFKEQLFIWKWPQGVFIYDTRPATTTDWLLTELTRAIGIAGPRALDVGADEVLFVSETSHLHLLSNVRANDVLASDLVAANMLEDWFKENVSREPSALARSTVKFYQERQEFHVALPGIGSSDCNIRVVVDMKKTGTPRLYVVNKDVCQSLATRQTTAKTQQLIGGDNAGTVWTLDEEGRTKGGTPYTCTFQTPNDDFAWVDPTLRTRQKNLAFLELLGVATGSFTFAIDTYLDGVFGETITFNLSGSGAKLGSFVLGTDKLASGNGPLATRKKMRGSCHRLSMVGRFTSDSSTFRIAGLVVSFTPGGHKR